MTSTTPPRNPALPATAAAVLVVLAYLAAPAAGVARGALHGLIGGAAVTATWWAVLRLPTGIRRRWVLLGLGLTLIVAADVATASVRLFRGASTLTLGPWHLLYSTGTLILATGLARVLDDLRRDRTVTLDAITVSTGIGVVVWVLVVEPAWAAVGGSTVARLHMALYPTTHLALFVVTVRGAMLRGRRSPSTALLLFGAGLQLFAAAAVGLGIVLDVYGPGSVLDLVWMAASVTFAAGVVAAGHSAALPIRSSDSVHGTRPRVMTLGASLLLLPALMLATADDGNEILVGAATGLILVLVTIRIGVLVRALERARERAVADQERRDQRRFEAIVRHAADAVLVIGRDGVVSYASPAATTVFATDPVGWTTGRLSERLHAGERRATVNALSERLAAAAGRPVRLRARLADRPDREHHVELVAVDLSDDPDVAGIVLTLHETTERTELEAKLRQLAFHDPLTGLHNREVFQDHLGQALERAARTERRLAVLLCDLDDFKDVNDTLGHPAGDRLLEQLAERLRSVTRSTDTVARLGGDEFAILCDDLPSAREAVLTAQRLLEAVREPVTVYGTELTIGMSVGIAIDTGERNVEELLRDADIALYDAKADGKHRWSLHRTTMTLRAQARLELAAELARDVEAGEIELVHQPIVALADGRMVGAEALMRWEHPVRGRVEPDEFIPVAEQSGLVVALGDVVLDRSLAALRGWLDVRPDLAVRLAVNCSTRQLHDLGLADRVLAMLARHEVDASLLMLELTESVTMGDLGVPLKVMHRLRSAGVRFAIDDFGTGYSSLSYLRRLPVDIIKIDRSFINELAHDAAARDLVRTIVDLGANLHHDVVAEGVETEEQRAILTEMGCGYGQGYLFSPPLPAASLGELLRSPAGFGLLQESGLAMGSR